MTCEGHAPSLLPEEHERPSPMPSGSGIEGKTMRAIEKEENTHMKKKALAALAGAVLTLSAATTGLAYQRATGGGAAAAVAQAPPASGVIVVDWNKELVRIVGTKAQPATVHPTRSLAIMHA